MAIDNKSYEPAGSPASPQMARKVLASNAMFQGARNVQASFTTAFGGNADLTFTAVAAGSAGNFVTIQYVVAGNSTPLTVAVSGNAITVNVATSSGGAATSIANQVLAALQASGPATALMAAALAPGSSGAGTVAALAVTPLGGGVDATKGVASSLPFGNALVEGATFKTGIHNRYA